MLLKLNDEQCQALAGQPTTPLHLVDEQTQAVYVLLSAEVYERLREKEPPMTPEFEVAPGIRRSRAAFLRDLPELMARSKLERWWAAYHGDERIGIARKKTPLVLECVRRGLHDDEYYVGIIRPYPEEEEEELEHSLIEYEEEEGTLEGAS